MHDRSLKADTEEGLEGGETGLAFDNIDSGLVFDSGLVSTSSLQARFDGMANDSSSSSKCAKAHLYVCCMYVCIFL